MARLLVLISSLFLVLTLGQFVKPQLVEDEDGSLNQLERSKADDLAKRFQWKNCRRTSDCAAGFYCRWYWCYPIQMCTSHRHCNIKSYCDTRDRVCKPGKRRCRSDSHCQSDYLYCKNSQCEKKECFHNYQCPSGQICKRPGVCANYVQTCEQHSHCKVPGYICINDLCKKRQCYRDSQCPFGHSCRSPGLCQLRQGYCLDESTCSSKQCCLKRRNTKVGMCTYLQRPGNWCDTKERYSCPCVDGYTCKRNSGYWGTCVYAPTKPPQPTTIPPQPTTIPPQPTTVEPTEEPGSGSGDFDY